MTTLNKESILLGLGYNFKGLLHQQHGREHRNMHKDNGSGEGAGSSTFASAGSRKREKAAGPGLGFSNPPKNAMKHFRQQSHTYSNEATPPKPSLMWE